METMTQFWVLMSSKSFTHLWLAWSSHPLEQFKNLILFMKLPIPSLLDLVLIKIQSRISSDSCCFAPGFFHFFSHLFFSRKTCLGPFELTQLQSIKKKKKWVKAWASISYLLRISYIPAMTKADMPSVSLGTLLPSPVTSAFSTSPLQWLPLLKSLPSPSQQISLLVPWMLFFLLASLS